MNTNQKSTTHSKGPVIIGISGKIGSGKDTAAKIIAGKIFELTGEVVERSPFAGALKRVVEVVSGIRMSANPNEYMSGDYDYSQEAKNIVTSLSGLTIGELLQKIGVGFRDTIDTDIWVKSNFAHIADQYEFMNKKYFIVPDVRFKNEADAILAAGGTLIRLNGDPGNVRASSKRDLNHSSETSLDNYKRFTYIVNTEQVNIEHMKILADTIVKLDILQLKSC